MNTQSLKMNRKTFINIIFCFAVILLFWIAPPVAPITAVGMRTIGVFIGTVLLLSLVDTVWPVVLAFGLISQTGVMSIEGVLSGSLGNWITTFVIMSFVLTKVLNESGFTTRLSAYYMSRKFVSKSPWIFTFAFMGLAMLVSLFMDQVPCAAFFLSFTDKILAELGYTRKDRYANVLTLGTVFAINIGGAATPISHLLALLGMGIYEQTTGEPVSMFIYMAYGIPIAIILFILLCLVIRFVLRPDVKAFENFDVKRVLEDVKPMGIRERVAVIVFFATVFCWVFPGLMKLFIPADQPFMIFISRFNITFCALIAVAVLAVLQIDEKPVVNLKQVLENGFPWGTILFISIGVLLGSAMSAEAVGLNEFIVLNLMPVVERVSPMVIVFTLAVVSCLLTNFASNVTTITVMTGVALSLSAGSGSLNALALAITTTINGSLAYMMPSSFATVAMLHANENSNEGIVIRYGLLFVLLSALVTSFVGYPILDMLL